MNQFIELSTDVVLANHQKCYSENIHKKCRSADHTTKNDGFLSAQPKLFTYHPLEIPLYIYTINITLLTIGCNYINIALIITIAARSHGL